MSNFSQAISIWKRGALAVALVFLLGVMAPIATLMFFTIIIILPMYLFGFSLEFLDEQALDFMLIAIAILGPYFLGDKWDEITNLVLKNK